MTVAALDLGFAIPEWIGLAVCPQTDPEAFFPENGRDSKQATAICRSCPVTSKCLAYSLEHEVEFGVWGGLTQTQRRRLVRQRYGPLDLLQGGAE